MADSFLAHVLLSFAVGGIGVGSATYAARKYYSGIGGLIGGLPSISSISFFFIGLNQSSDAASQATSAFPLGMSFTFLFLLIYTSLAEYGFKTAMTIGLVAWFSFSSVEAYIHLQNLVISLIAVSTIFTTSQYLFKHRFDLKYTKGAGEGLSAKKFAEFAIPGGAVVAGAVYFSQVLGTTAGGVSAAFPAIFSLTLTFTYLSEGGMNLSRSMTKPLMIAAYTAALPYSVLVGLLYPIQGLYLGTLVAAVADLPFVFLAYFLIHERRI